ncbi:hypothetical protein Tco_0668203 [Tanacetum coccineum]
MENESVWRDLFAEAGLGSVVVPADELSFFVVCVLDLWWGIVKTIVSAMSSMMSCGGVPVKKLEMVVGARNWLDMMVLYCRKFADEHRDVAIRLNRLVGEMNEACQDRIAFVREIKSVAGVTVTVKTAMFLKEMMNKEGSKEWQLRDLEKEARERALEIELFV